MNHLPEQSMLPKTLVPSLPAASFAELEKLAQALDGTAPGFQIDIVDGLFVPHRAWPFTEEDVASQWKKLIHSHSHMSMNLIVW